MKNWISFFIVVVLLSSCSILTKNKKVAELPRQGKENHIYGTVDREYVDMERQYENGEQKPVYFNHSSSS
jgi:hypothetical protein